MHNAPSEASILRSLYEKEVRDHEATREKLKRLQVALEHTLSHASYFNVNMRHHEIVKAALNE